MPARKYAKDGNTTFNDDLLQLLAAASLNAYDNLEGGTKRNKRYMGKALDLLLHGGHDSIGWSLLKIQYHGKYADKYIFAIRGTDPSVKNNLISDWSMYMGKMDIIRHDISQVEEWYQQILDTGVTPDYITGHSLGGTVAEVMAAKYGIDGVSFAAPGPYSDNDDYNLIKGLDKNITKSRFLAIVNPNDFVPNPSRDNVGALASCMKTVFCGIANPKQYMRTYKELTNMTNPEDTHIVKVRSVTEPFGKISDLSCHKISGYVEAVGELNQKKIDKYHANLAETQPSKEKNKKRETKDGKKSSSKESQATSKGETGESSRSRKKQDPNQEDPKSKKKERKGSSQTSTLKEGEKSKSKDDIKKPTETSSSKKKSTTSRR